MVQGLQTLCLHKQLIQCLRSLTELLVLIILSYKGLHHTDGRDILLNGTVQVVVTQEHLCEELYRTRDDQVEGGTKDDQCDDEDQAHPQVDEDTHEHTEHQVQRSTHGDAHEHLESLLQTLHIGGHAGNQSATGILVDIREREGLDIPEHRVAQVGGEARGGESREAS